MAYQITEQCIGCSLCADMCPVKAIGGKLKEVHSINQKRCVECGVCARLCRKRAIVDSRGNRLEPVPREEWKKPAIDEQRCSACSMCVLECQKKALDIIRPKYQGDIQVYAHLYKPEECIGCGMCADVCPLHAIRMEGP